jgi:hypothetical protein
MRGVPLGVYTAYLTNHLVISTRRTREASQHCPPPPLDN